MATNTTTDNTTGTTTTKAFMLIVEAAESLSLEGDVRTIARVKKGQRLQFNLVETTRMEKLMTKYAHNFGLRRENLDFYFVDKIEPNDTPITLCMKDQDLILVRNSGSPVDTHRRLLASLTIEPSSFLSDFSALLFSNQLSDIVFVVHSNSAPTSDTDEPAITLSAEGSSQQRLSLSPTSSPSRPSASTSGSNTPKLGATRDSSCHSSPSPMLVNKRGSIARSTKKTKTAIRDSDTAAAPIRIPAHRIICSSRCERFRLMFCNGMQESTQREIDIYPSDENRFSVETFKRLLEYIYTDDIGDLSPSIAEELIGLADEYLLPRLKQLCEMQVTANLDVENSARLFILADRYRADQLKKSCMQFIIDKFFEVSKTTAFIDDLARQYPELLLEITSEAVKTAHSRLAASTPTPTPTPATSSSKSSDGSGSARKRTRHQ